LFGSDDFHVFHCPGAIGDLGMLTLEKPELFRRQIHASKAPAARYAFRRIFRPRTIKLDGLRFVIDPTRMNFRNIKLLYRETYEAEERLIAKEIIKPKDRVLEGGAGIGLTTMTVARIIGPENVISYEPTPVTFSLLSENLQTNGLQVKIRQRALGIKEATARFHAQVDLLSSSFLQRNGNGQVIQVSVDGIADVLLESKANVLILDIEGSEIDLLTADAFQQIDKMIVEFHPQLVGMAKISSTVAKLRSTGLHLRSECSYGKILVFLRN
jgi:FkbM family methyltransferase